MSACYPPSFPPPVPASPLVVPGQGQDDPPSPPERLISVDDVLRDLDDALRWLQAEEQVQAGWLSAEAREKLIARVTLRIVRPTFASRPSLSLSGSNGRLNPPSRRAGPPLPDRARHLPSAHLALGHLAPPRPPSVLRVPLPHCVGLSSSSRHDLVRSTTSSTCRLPPLGHRAPPRDPASSRSARRTTCGAASCATSASSWRCGSCGGGATAGGGSCTSGAGGGRGSRRSLTCGPCSRCVLHFSSLRR